MQFSVSNCNIVHYPSPKKLHSCLKSVCTLLASSAAKFSVSGLPSCFSKQGNEYVFSLMGPKGRPVDQNKEEKDGGSSLKSNKESSITGEEQHSQKTRVKSDGRLILGLKFSGKRLHFLYKGHRGVVEHWVFRGTQLADSQWHTLVLAIGSHHVKLTVDCSSPVEM